MITDAQNQFSDAQVVTAPAKSTNIIDLGIERRIGTGENLYIVVSVETTLDDAGDDSVVTVSLEADDNEGMASPAAIQTLGDFPAESVAGTRIVARIQPEILTQRFIQLDYAIAGGDLSAGAFDAFIVHDIDAFTAYAKGFLVTS